MLLQPYIEDSGRTGVTVLFVHSLAGSTADWAAVRRLLRHFRTVAYDGHGMGQTPMAASGKAYTMEVLISELDNVIGRIATEPVHLVGASMGGGIIQNYVLRHPEKVASLTLVASRSSFTDTMRERFRADAERAERDGMAALGPELVERWFSAAFRRRMPQLVHTLRRRYESIPAEVFARRCLINAERNLTHQLSDIPVPVLCVNGAEDPGFDLNLHRSYRELVRLCDTVVLGGVSHAIEHEAPEVLAGLIAMFVSTANSRIK